MGAFFLELINLISAGLLEKDMADNSFISRFTAGFEVYKTGLSAIDSRASVKNANLDIEAIGASMEKATPGHPMAKATIDIALHDLNAKTLGIPVYQLLGGKFREKIRLGSAIGISNTEQMVSEAYGLVERGCKDIKIKIGIDPQADLQRVQEIRNIIGPEPRLFVDGNQGCSLNEYLPVFKKMEKYDLAFIEQPLPIWDINGYQKLCAILDIPILIDEGVYTPNDLMTLIKHQAIDAVNIKILKTGLTGGKKISAIAESAGLPCHLGSMFETGVGTAASIHFAISTRCISNSCECFFPTFLTEDVIEGDIYSITPENWAWELPQGCGLGISLKPDIYKLLN